jgi:microcystin-dependent protein
MAFLGEIALFAGTTAPYGWVFCDGQLLFENDYPALFHLIGETYGSNKSEKKFAVPNLCARVPIGTGQENQQAHDYDLAELGGTEEITLQESNIPKHNHKLLGKIRVSSQEANSNTPGGNYFSYTATDKDYSDKADKTMNPSLIVVGLGDSSVGSMTPRAINNMQPYIAINYIICASDYPYPSPS